ncbi:hypothetical protein OAI57_02010 [Gammaproteobacteria bacterium]|nr:hypothetical protein [Gammaproteobacteria bacterium]
MCPSKLNSHKILVIYSYNLINNFDNHIKAAIKDGYRVLALDIGSALKAKKLGASCEFIEDFLSNKERLNLHIKAREAEEEFPKHSYKNNINSFMEIAQKDRVVLTCYWYEYILQRTLFSKFKNLGITHLKFFKFEGYGPAVHESLASTFGNYWLSQKNYMHIEPEFIYKINSITQKYVEGIKKTINYSFNSLLNLRTQKKKKAIIFCCTFEEFYYYKKIILSVHKKVDGSLYVLMNNINNLAALKLSRKYNLNIKSLHLNHSKVFSFDRADIKQEKVYSENLIDEAYMIDRDHFQHFESQRWPLLRGFKKELKNFIEKLNPSFVVFTALEEHKNQLIGEIANENYIKSISLPHGILGSTRRGISTASEYAVGNDLAKEIAGLSGIDKKKIIVLQGLDPAHEYAMDNKITVPQGFNILVLTNPVKSSSDTRVYSTPPIGYKDQITALKDIQTLTEKLPNANLIIKTHPGWPETEVIEFADNKLMNLACSKQTSLSDLIPQIDLVIALNYYGAALVTVLRNSKPIIFHYTAPILDFEAMHSSYSVFAQAGEISQNTDELIRKCNLVKTSPQFKESLVKQSTEFSNRFIAPGNALEITTYLTQEHNKIIKIKN